MGLVVFALVVLLWPLRTDAGIVHLAFDDELEWQPGSTYILDLVTTHGGRVVTREQGLSIVPKATCAERSVPDRTPETLCADVCLEPGDYRLTVRAVTRDLVSAPSQPALEVDLSTTAPCRPITVVKGPPPQKPPPETIVLGPGVVGVTVLLTQGAKPPSVPALPNMGCVSWKVVGPCPCLPSLGCLAVEYYEPGWLIETVLRPGTTTLDILAPILDAALVPAGALGLGGGGAGQSGGAGHTNLQYTEAHVYTFPQLLGGPCTACAPAAAVPVLHYASELDTATWRTAAASALSPLDALLRVGVWGFLYPRGGKSITSSKPVASGLAAVRAMDIAFQPIGTPPHVDVHVVIAPTEGYSRCLQMAWPKQTPCLQAGTPPPLWETASVSPGGNYVWIAWRRRTCCVNPNMTTCGITLPGVGGSGENWCALP